MNEQDYHTVEMVAKYGGSGWTVTIRSRKPISSEAKKKLIEVSELLDAGNSG